MVNHSFLEKRKSTIAQWSPSDSEKNYVTKQKNGKDNYSLKDVNYVYNATGFRCDDFSTDRDLSVLFMGCSFTEGIGLPLQYTWAHRVLTDIKCQPQHSEKKIPFFSLALAGSGFDTMARELYTHCTTIRPDYIFYLSSSVYRREVLFQDSGPRLWLPTDSRHDPKSPLVRVLTDTQYAVNQTYRSLMVIDAIAQKFNTKVIVMQLRNGTEEKCDFGQASVDYTSFRNITQRYIPVDLYDTFPEHSFLFPGHPDNARDNWHPGVTWQYEIAQRATLIINDSCPFLLKGET